MPRATRTLLCRLGLLLFCVAPTIAVGTWIVTHAAGGAAAQKAEWERDLTSRVGLAVEIEEITYPRPNVVRLKRVRLLDQKTRAVLLDSAALEVSRTASGWNITALEPRLEAQPPSEFQVPATIHQPARR